MCFAPQRRALFRHRNFQKWSGPGVFCTFSLGNVLRATTACTFSTSQLPKVVRDRQFLTLLTSKCASRHNGVHFFISHLARCLRTRRFSEPTFRPSGATNHWKNTVNRDFPTFSRICIFFLLIFSLLTLLTSAFQLSILSEVSLLNFLRQSRTGKTVERMGPRREIIPLPGIYFFDGWRVHPSLTVPTNLPQTQDAPIKGTPRARTEASEDGPRPLEEEARDNVFAAAHKNQAENGPCTILHVDTTSDLAYITSKWQSKAWMEIRDRTYCTCAGNCCD